MRRVVNHELAAQLAVEGAQARRHQGRQVALDDPLLKENRARSGLDQVKQAGTSKVSDLTLVVDEVHQQVEEGEVLLLGPAGKLLAVVELPRVWTGILARLEPGGQDVGVEADLGGDVEGELDDAALRVGAQAEAVRARDAHQEVGQAGGEGVILNKGFLLTLDKTRKEENGLFDDPFVGGAQGDLGHRDVDLFGGGEGDARMGKGTAGFIIEEVCELL